MKNSVTGTAQFVDALGHSHAQAGSSPRIVCLVPSITELLFDLGLGRQVVGRTGFCFHPKAKVKHVPRVGGTKDFDLDKIRALEATHLIVEAAAAFIPNVIVTHPLGPLDNIDLYRLLGTIFARQSEAEELTARFDRVYRNTVEATCHLAGERVLYLIWKKPWMTISRDTYIARTLAAVGWDQIDVDSDARYPEVDIESRLGSVDRVLLSSEPYAFRPRDVAEVESMAGGGTRPAVSLIDAEMTSWYGSRAIAGMKYLAQQRSGQ